MFQCENYCTILYGDEIEFKKKNNINFILNFTMMYTFIYHEMLFVSINHNVNNINFQRVEKEMPSIAKVSASTAEPNSGGSSKENAGMFIYRF